MALSSVDSFANYVIQSDRCPLSLRQSKEVLYLRKYLQEHINTSQKQFKNAYIQLETAKKNLKELKQNKKQIEENGQYKKL